MPVTIATISIMPGQSLSTSLDCSSATPVRIHVPFDWQGGGTDVITFQVSHDNITFADLFRVHGKEVEATLVPGTVIAAVLDMGLKSGQYIKIRAGRRDRPIIQSVQRDFVIMLES